MNKYGLVLAGGGAKGAYQLGAWKAMTELGISFSVVVGTSVGSINGAFVAADAYDDAYSFWSTASLKKGVKLNEELKDPENLFSLKNFSSLLKEVIKNGGIDASPTKDFLASYIDEEKVRNSPVRLGVVTFHLSEFEPLKLFVEDIPQGELINYLLASSKIPLASKIGPEGEKFLDGGVYDNAPISMLRENGYNKLIVVDISNISGVGHRLELDCAQVIYIRPYDADELGASFDFSEEIIEKRIKMGYLDAMKAFGHLSGRRFYLKDNDFRDMVLEYGADACAELEALADELKMEKFKVYSKDDFLVALKTLCTELKKENEAENEEEERRIVEFIRKTLSSIRSGKNYSKALAVLDNIVI